MFEQKEAVGVEDASSKRIDLHSHAIFDAASCWSSAISSVAFSSALCGFC
jgi:hypothetical protein